MKSIYSYIATFTISLFVVCAILGTGCYYYTYSKINKHLFDTDKSKHILVLGDSQLECAVNEAYFPEVFNRCKSSDSYLFCYAKLKEMVENNPQIDMLLLSFSHTSMTANVDKRMHSEGINKRLILYGPYLTLNDLEWFTLEELKDNLINFMFPDHMPQPEPRGGYNRRLASEGFHKANKNADKGSLREEIMYGNACSKFYLKRIEKFCSDHHIKLIFVTAPIHSTNPRQSYWRDILKSEFCDFKHLDFERTLNDTLFYDIDHLNENGAKVFSSMLRNILNCD